MKVIEKSILAETSARLKWFINLRWVAILGIILMAALLQYGLKFPAFSASLGLILVGMILSNLFFYSISGVPVPTRVFSKINLKISPILSANIQIGVDLFFLTLIWHRYGAIENPIIFFFIFHMIIAGILLGRVNSYMWALLSSLLVVAIALLEYGQILEHQNVVSKYTGIIHWDNASWNTMILSAFCFTLFCTIFMTTSISERLRAREEEIIMLEKKVAHQKVLESEKKLFLSEKMASLGKLAAGMAHEINNPLTTILSYSEILDDALKDSPEDQEDLHIIKDEVLRIRRIVRQILDFAHEDVLKEPAYTDINAELQKLINKLSIRFDFQKVSIQQELAPTLPLARISSDHLTQILTNLIVNGAQATDNQGNLKLTTSYDVSKDKIIFACTDNGVGIASENISKIFDPFFTTKKQGQGTGLGLSVSYGLVKLYGGQLSVKSKLHQGTTFTMTIPPVETN